MFSEQDKVLLGKKRISEEQVIHQISLFQKGVPYVKVERPATVSDGIKQFSIEEEANLITYYDNFFCKGTVLKFVPASGAATRMFKALSTFYFDKTADVEDETHKEVKCFFSCLKDFAFYHSLQEIIADKESKTLDDLLAQKDYHLILEYVLTGKGLNYGHLPKGLLAFHRYSELDVRTAFEEHWVEGVEYAQKNDRVHLHFTVSPEHKDAFNDTAESLLPDFSRQYPVDLKIDYSFQDERTDTIAVNLDNELFRDDNGALLFRPAGHGALIYNLNTLDSDMVFVKNIDNVVVDRMKETTVRYKKILAGYLLKLRIKIHAFVKLLDAAPDKFLMDSIEAFMLENYLIDTLPEWENQEQRRQWLFDFLNRPIRVAGMVRNEGEPGGGPYWVKNKTHQYATLQIVEAAQINDTDETQKAIMQQATHFNPVDLVLWLKDYQEKKFNLLDYVDGDTYFISSKSKDGKPLKALELPGLWNGAMAHWLTVFVEVPIETFNPVKTITDLLRPAHQNTEK
jgi:hypothetical protein